jgi:hypothetical protein
LLQSTWFTDTSEKSMKLTEKTVGKVLKDDGNFLLPSITLDSDEKEVRKNMQIVHAQVGHEARHAMQEFLSENKIPREHKFFLMLDEIFGE